jgi:hypothetical protein
MTAVVCGLVESMAVAWRDDAVESPCARSLYESEWVRLELADVELTDGTRLDHHVIRIPFEVVSLVVWDADCGVLLIWRYRFITIRASTLP